MPTGVAAALGSFPSIVKDQPEEHYSLVRAGIDPVMVF
jgi:hypothetical protein